MFRYERPQAGRLREHHQFGVEVFGAPEATLDAEIIAMALDIVGRFGIKDLSLNINSIGCPVCRAKYNQALREYCSARSGELCATCRERLEKNPLRILDCKVPSCGEIAADAPVILDYICPDCAAHLEKLKSLLTAAGIEFNIDPHIVRGLDYYVKTVFEIIYTQPDGSKITVCGGGRYDDLSKQMSDVSVASAGFGMGLERILMVMENAGVLHPQEQGCRLYVATIGDAAAAEGFRLVQQIRKSGISAELNHCARSVKAQLKYANKINAQNVIVIGDNEVISDSYTVKDMLKGLETAVLKEDIVQFFKKI